MIASTSPLPTATTGEGTRPFRGLLATASPSAVAYGLVAWLSPRFDVGQPNRDRPIVCVLLLLLVAFALYLVSVRLARRAPQNKSLIALIFTAALIFRVILLVSVPIQEIDIYRYLWDGAVANAGVSPFRFAPGQVRNASGGQVTDPQLARLVRLRDSNSSLATILSRIHYGDLPTIYPPVSQVVFAAVTLVTPPDASVAVRVMTMKAGLLGFDMATLVVLVRLLRRTQRPIGESVIYAWCPLVIKEFANSGHLDSVAVFLTMLAVYLAVQWNGARGGHIRPAGFVRRIITYLPATAVGLVLALAVGAKLYPIVVVPVLLIPLARQWGAARVAVAFGVVLLGSAAVLSPMRPVPNTAETAVALIGNHTAETAVAPPVGDNAIKCHGRPGRANPSLGLTTFLRHWEMNDFLFLLLVENLKPAAHMSPGGVAWFSVVPEPFRQRVVEAVAGRNGAAPAEVPFLVSRAITAAAFAVVALILLGKAVRATDDQRWLECVFLTLAWFWLLSPTQNPWYWSWAVPLLPFARGRAWLAVSGIVLIYYLRFWFGYHHADTPVWGTPYVGVNFFDFVVTWVEYGPWLVWLLLDWALRRA